MTSFILPLVSLVLMAICFEGVHSRGGMILNRVVSNIAAPQNDGEALIEWVLSKGGFFSEKLEIRRMDPNNEMSPFGVFAKQHIGTEEKLFQIPNQCYIGLRGDEIRKMQETDEQKESFWLDQEQTYWENLCRLTQKLIKEMSTDKKESEYLPYIAYLEKQRRGQLPAAWSKAGKTLLRKVLGPGASEEYGNHVLPPKESVDWIHERFVKSGCIDGDDLFEHHAAEMVVQRGYDTELIPIWDMVNHDNGRVNTNITSKNSDGGIKVWSTKTIQAGEEIYATYNQYTDSDTVEHWGTPEIFRDFGFVEQYPQRWVFMDHDIWFELYEDEMEPGQLKVFFKDNDGVPNNASLSFLRKQLVRLESMSEDDLMERGTVPKHEWEAIFDFHNAATTAIESVIQATLKLRKEM